MSVSVCWRLCAGLCLLVGWAGTAGAQWFVEAGGSCARPHGDGIWRQAAFPHRLSTCGPTLGLGYRAGGWSLGATHLLATSSDALALTTESDYDSVARRCIANCDQMGRFETRGQVYGLFARREWVTVQGAVLEFGALAYVPAHTVRVSEFHSRDQHGVPFGPAEATYRNRFEVRASPSVGVGWRSDRWRLLARWYPWVKSSGDRLTEDGTSYRSLTSLYSGQVTTVVLLHDF